MKSWMAGIMAWLAGVLLLPATTAHAQILQQRCSVDSLLVDQAEARLEWMRRCALLVNVGSPYSGYDTGSPSGNGMGNLIEYLEGSDPWGTNLYTGTSYGHNINDAYISSLYLTAIINQDVDSNGFYKWWVASSRKKSRPLYPIYGSNPDIYSPANQQLFPHPYLAGCGLYLDRYGSQPASTFYLNAFCEAGSIAMPVLTNDAPSGPLSDIQNGEKHFTIYVPAGLSRLTFDLSGGTGDADLYVQYGSRPTLTSYTCRPYLNGNSETCIINSPAAGSWYVTLRGWFDYSGVMLKARY